jgi:cytoskeletal protein RodZ
LNSGVYFLLALMKFLSNSCILVLLCTGMVPMMNSQFAMRYPGANPYAGMAQQALPMQTPQQAQHMQPTQTPQPPQDQEATGSAAASAAASTASSNESTEPAQPSTTDQSQPQQPLQQQQQGGVPMPYGVPPGAYYGGGMGMHPNARAPHMGNFHPQMVG